jgi:hypothetical protein
VGTQTKELVNKIGGDTNHGNGKIHAFGGSLMIFYLERNPCVKQEVSSRFPFRFLVPRRCRVTLQPGLGGQNSISFLGLQGEEPLLIKPD